MTQAHPVPYVHAGDGLSVQHMTSRTVALIGARERTNQIELRAGIDNPSDAAQNSIHFSKCTKSIDVNRLQARGLREKFLVGHVIPRHRWNRDHRTISTWLSSNFHSTDKLLIGSLSVSTPDNLNIATSSQFVAPARDGYALIVERCPRFPATISASNSNPDRGYMGQRLNPALGTSVVSCGEGRGDTFKQLSMASRLTPPRPQDSIPEAGPCGWGAL